MNTTEKILLLVGVGVVAAWIAYEVYEEISTAEAVAVGGMASAAVFLICPECFLATALAS